ncbi:MAG: hypothetical protein WD314_14990 [Trueperaceae bacterium]
MLPLIFAAALAISLAACSELNTEIEPEDDEPAPAVERRTVAVGLAGDGSGRVASDPAGIDCGASCSAEFSEGSQVALSAAAAHGSRFEGWSSSSCGGGESCVLTLSGDVTVEATFAAEPSPSGSAEGSFSVVVIPDTQNLIMRRENTMVTTMARWVVDSRDELDIRFVSQLGDVVDDGSKVSEWQRADRMLGLLDGVVPYSVALGDHDYAIEEDMGSSTANYRAWFGPERYREYDWYRGSGPNGVNHYQVFEAGGREFLHVALEWEAPGPADDPASPLGWARQVISDHPELPTIISTHAYLWDYPGQEGRTWASEQLEGSITLDGGSMTFPGTTGQGMFEALVEPFPHVFMVLNGHYHKASGTDDGEYHQVSRNETGLEVYEMLSNYQSYPNGGDGWLRIIEFVPSGGEGGSDRIAVSTYSPVLNRFQTDARSRFHFDLVFEERFPRD